MSKIERIFSEVSLNLRESCELDKLDKSKKDKIVTSRLIDYIAEHIENNIEELPIDKKKSIDPTSGNEIYRFEMTIIDKEELKELQEIKRMYYELMSKK